MRANLHSEKSKKIADLIVDCFEREGKVLICGNGGSGCDAAHFAEEFTGRFRKDRRALPVIALMDPAHITCVANDFGYHAIFSRSIAAFGKKGDILIALSTSGNSTNVKEAIVEANEIGMTTIALLGRDGGHTKGLSHCEILVPGQFSDRIQEVHCLCFTYWLNSSNVAYFRHCIDNFWNSPRRVLWAKYETACLKPATSGNGGSMPSDNMSGAPTT